MPFHLDKILYARRLSCKLDFKNLGFPSGYKECVCIEPSSNTYYCNKWYCVQTEDPDAIILYVLSFKDDARVQIMHVYHYFTLSFNVYMHEYWIACINGYRDSDDVLLANVRIEKQWFECEEESYNGYYCFKWKSIQTTSMADENQNDGLLKLEGMC